MTPPLHLLWDGPENAAATVVLAHGAGAGMEHPFLAAVAAGLADAGLRVVRFEFPYQRDSRAGHRRAPDRLPVLRDCMREVVASCGPGRVVLMGKSMGGRVATTLADELGAAAVVVFGYPFHPPRKPEQLRTAHLEALRTPTLILQGARDPFGTRAEVDAYPLSAAITVRWFADGDHSLAPRKRSGHSAEAHLAAAIAAAAAFAQR
ncbi:MAG: alpha/beta fold hydrolase [Planctomycetes bacterium]|nr:alpha/beta fold hydrolase [Planctomycetota bacterium]MCB9885261.1 alpha/beta fold hydrolase [Planctomycetota bacterium]